MKGGASWRPDYGGYRNWPKVVVEPVAVVVVVVVAGSSGDYRASHSEGKTSSTRAVPRRTG